MFITLLLFAEYIGFVLFVTLSYKIALCQSRSRDPSHAHFGDIHYFFLVLDVANVCEKFEVSVSVVNSHKLFVAWIVVTHGCISSASMRC